jgi:hypothetical protein
MDFLSSFRHVHPFGCAKPLLSRGGKEARLRVNLERVPAFRTGESRGSLERNEFYVHGNRLR